jgi:hypothetical protein
MEAICSSETSVDFHRTTRHYIADDRTIVRLDFKDLLDHFHRHGFQHEIVTRADVKYVRKSKIIRTFAITPF